MPRYVALILVAVLAGIFLPHSLPVLADAPDYDIPNGHFYTQAVGAGTPGGYGHSIADSGIDSSGQTIMFWSEFKRLGGVAALGYPSSERFMLDGFWTQATQRVLLQWRPELKAAVFVNIFDKLHDSGLDARLQAIRQVPLQLNDNDSCASGDLNCIRPYRLSWLNVNPSIKQWYFSSSPDPVTMYGLPTSHIDTLNGPFDIIRLQRIVIQYWKVAVPGIATPGMITVALGGDIAKAEGLVPAQVSAAVPPPALSVPAAGQILFGSDYRYNGTEFQVSSTRTVFHPGEQIGYAAHLSQPVGSTTLLLHIFYSAPGGISDSTTATTTVSGPTVYLLANRLDAATTAKLATGTYRLQFARTDGTVLAEGSFEIEASSIIGTRRAQ